MGSCKISVNKGFMERRLRLRNTMKSPLSEQDIVDATVAFANGATIELLDLVEPIEPFEPIEFCHATLSESAIAELSMEDAQAALDKNERLLEEYEKSVGQLKTKLLVSVDFDRRLTRDILRAQVSHPLGSTKALLAVDLFPSINIRPRLRKVGNGFSLSFFYFFASESALVHLGRFLLVDRARPFGNKLCQCELESCGLFFFEVKPPTGRPQRKYCCSAHMIKAHDQNAAERMRRKRSSERKGNK